MSDEITKNQIIHGDCFDVLRKMEKDSVDLVLMDPPYKVSQNYGTGVDADNLRNVASIYKLFPEITRVLKNNKFVVTFYDNRIFPVLFDAVRGTELVYRKSIFLYRRWGIAHRWMGWMQTTDPVCFFINGQNQPLHAKDIKAKVKHDCYIKDKPEKETTGHPAQKPLEIIEDIIQWCSKENDVVLDPYCGSGTVELACKKLNRRFIGIDIEKKYVEMTKERLNNPQTILTNIGIGVKK